MTSHLHHIEAALRRLNVDALIIFGRDSYDNEWVSRDEAYVKFATGFAGSNGDVIIWNRSKFPTRPAQLFTDSRYFIQGEETAKKEGFHLMREVLHQSLLDYLLEVEDCTIGVDFRCISVNKWILFRDELKEKGSHLVDCKLVSDMWDATGERPSRNTDEPFYCLHSEDTKLKMKVFSNYLFRNALAWGLLTRLEEIAWLLNLRGKFLKYSCVPRALFGFEYNPEIEHYKYYLYCDDIPDERVHINNPQYYRAIKQDFERYNITVLPYDDAFRFTSKLRPPVERGIFDADSGSMEILRLHILDRYEVPLDALNAGISRICFNPSPINMWKSIKTNMEQTGFSNCHVIDGIALAVALAELELNFDEVKHTECSFAERVEELRSDKKRKESYCYLGPSFKTISAYGENAAEAHYMTDETCTTVIADDSFFLVDTGGHYSEGTTDVTRTIHLGNPTDKERAHWTLVLKGLIGMSRAVFPSGIPNIMLDTFARKSLWEFGLDYDHGTSHGVGQAISVHEYPPLISKGNRNEKLNGDGKIYKGMVMSIEPGYYLDEAYGIRHENVVRVAECTVSSGIGSFLTTSSFTCVPFQTAGIVVPHLLTREEISWLNSYQSWVHQTLRTMIIAEHRYNSNSELFAQISLEEFLFWLERTCMPI